MKKVLTIAGFLILTALVFSQAPGIGRCMMWNNWDSSKLITADGEVVAGMPLRFKTKIQSQERLYDLHIGPYWYLSRMGVTLSPGERIKVKGYPLVIGNRSSLLVSEITVKGKTYRLRDENGRPLWWNFSRGPGAGAHMGRCAGAGVGRGRRGGTGRW